MAFSKPSSSKQNASTSTSTSTSAQAQASASSTAANPLAVPAQPSKLAKNPRLPATMITPAGHIQASQKANAKSNKGQVSRKKKMKSEKGRERALELSEKLENQVRLREEKKAKRQRAKKAWE
ncbi:hypothetical protein IAU59_003798 [Kwoniella sp. CBS 9459]